MDDTAMEILFFVFGFIAILGFVLSLYFKKVTKNQEEYVSNAYGDNENGVAQEECNVKVLNKSVEKNEQWQVEICKIVFEFANGERMCLGIRDTDVYQKIMVGDVGTLRHCGKKFISFK